MREKTMHGICFHHIDEDLGSEYDVAPTDLERFVRAVVDGGAVFLKPSTLAESFADPRIRLAEDAVCLIFDDGYRSTLEFAAPLMAKLGVVFGLAPATALLLDDQRPLAAPEGSRGFLSVDDLKLWTAVGGEILGHSHSHVALSALATSTVEHELDTELAIYAEHGLPAPELFVYPFGAHDERVRRAVAARYRGAFAGDCGSVAGPDHRFDLHRVTFRQKLLPGLLRLDWASLDLHTHE
ncbi:polysaccharide deacetylase family protein [Streptomyces sp. BE230]|uniref:polysaccharide deacetylase family protein n=1 Tax=Streptomyces sp. BE230 TaxID=3002526 RepID=UPI002ED2CD7A|nr:polysaccharide deacetylase family protein [Streptomyces sp. BE230]